MGAFAEAVARRTAHTQQLNWKLEKSAKMKGTAPETLTCQGSKRGINCSISRGRTSYARP